MLGFERKSIVSSIVSSRNKLHENFRPLKKIKNNFGLKKGKNRVPFSVRFRQPDKTEQNRIKPKETEKPKKTLPQEPGKQQGKVFDRLIQGGIFMAPSL